MSQEWGPLFVVWWTGLRGDRWHGRISNHAGRLPSDGVLHWSMDLFCWENLQEDPIFNGKIYGFWNQSIETIETMDFPIEYGA